MKQPLAQSGCFITAPNKTVLFGIDIFQKHRFMSSEIKNRVTESGLITLDLEQFLPVEEMVELDIRSFLFMERILKEQDFRERLKNYDWEYYRSKHVAVHCSVDAIVPAWAYMSIAVCLHEVAKSVYQGTLADMQKDKLSTHIRSMDGTAYHDKRVLIKGCGDKNIDAAAYLEITSLLMPYVKSIMYGEACSAVPVFKRKAVEK